MRLLIDARKITDGGIGTYTAALLGALSAERVLITALIAASQRTLLPQNVIPLVTHYKPYSEASFLALSAGIPWGLFDLYHSPHFLLPRNVPIPSVVTVHDVIPISHPSSFLHQRVMSYLLMRLEHHASVVLTVSNASASRLRALVGVEAQVVPNILPFEVLEASQPPAAPEQRYVVGVFSNPKQHKGQRAFAEVCARCRVHGLAIGRGAKSLRGAPFVTCVSERSWSELLEIYRGASALVVASVVEGFCLPAMEAKALGVRVVSTPELAVCEFLDDNDEIALDFTSEALGAALERALARPQGGYRWENGHDFSPQRVAKRLMNIYHRALGSTGDRVK